ncbi:MAG TPA: hypothetical protein VIM88_06025 [Sulfurovum sp.]|uniref:hypothetical protein n=1 Tax=Sulfurovum sp. TaxID=1969726 RepID=UPI002F94FCD4
MSSSLEKLKALSSRLEGKLEEKGKAAPAASDTLKKEDSTASKPAPKPVAEPAKKRAKKEVDSVRQENIERVRQLYDKLKIFEKSPDFEKVFVYKAMNLSGISLKEEDFGAAREGKYIQVIAITYEPDKNGKKKAKNISLGYFGKAETLDNTLKHEIIEFVLRWRYEKAFQNLEHYKDLISRVETPVTTLF